jgi:septation ring formation regulator EzrA
MQVQLLSSPPILKGGNKMTDSIHTEIEEKLGHFERVIDHFDKIKTKKDHVRKKFEELKKAEPNTHEWHTVKEEVDKYMGDIDDDLRAALEYFA